VLAHFACPASLPFVFSNTLLYERESYGELAGERVLGNP
jgi:hypothetical protein